MNQKTINNLIGYIEMMEREEYNSQYYKLAADLRRLLEHLKSF